MIENVTTDPWTTSGASSSGTDVAGIWGAASADQDSGGPFEMSGYCYAAGSAVSAISKLVTEFTVDANTTAQLGAGWDIYNAYDGEIVTCLAKLEDLTTGEVLIAFQPTEQNLDPNPDPPIEGSVSDTAALIPGHSYRLTIVNDCAGGDGGEASADFGASLGFTTP